MAADGAGGSGAAVRQLTNLGAGSVAAGLGGGMLYGIPTSYRTPQRAALFGAKLFAGGYAGVLAFGGLAYARTRMDLTPHSQAQIGQALAYPTILAGAVGMSGVGVGVGWFLGAPAGYLTGAYTLVKGSSSIRAWGPPAVAAALVASSSVALLDVLKWDREHSEKWDK